MSLVSRFEVRPVGQGAFIRGCEHIGWKPYRRHKATVRWIYDCGTDAGQALINASITDLGVSWPPYCISRQSLDVLVISHFDKDHISGLPLLLTRYHFKRVFMPQVPRLVRLVAGLSNLENAEIGVIANLLWFLDDPVEYIAERSPGGQTSIVLVEPAEDPPDRPEGNEEIRQKEETADPPEVEDPSYPAGDDIITATRRPEPNGLHQPSPNVTLNVSKSGAPFVWSGEWELVPYIDKNAKNAFLTFSTGVQKKLDDQLKELLDLAREAAGETTTTKKKVSAIKEGIRDLRDAIYEEIAKVQKKKNVSSLTKNAISLMIYAGPVRIQSAYTKILIGADAPNGSMKLRNLAGFSATGSGVLLTGDADLSAEDKVDRLQSFMTQSRIGTLGVFQIPHHGSLNNSERYTANVLGAPFNVVNANPHARHKHPDASVVTAFQTATSVKGPPSPATVALANSRAFETIAFTWDRSLPRQNCWWWRRDTQDW